MRTIATRTTTTRMINTLSATMNRRRQFRFFFGFFDFFVVVGASPAAFAGDGSATAGMAGVSLMAGSVVAARTLRCKRRYSERARSVEHQPPDLLSMSCRRAQARGIT